MDDYYDPFAEDLKQNFAAGEDYSPELEIHVYFCEWSNCWVAYDANTADYIDNEMIVKYRGEGKTEEEAILDMMREVEDDR